MFDFNRISDFSSEGQNPVPIHRLTEYFRHTLSEPFESAESPHTPRQVGMSSGRTWARFDHRLSLTEEDMLIHARLFVRLAELRYESHGLWPKAKRLLRAIARIMLWPFVRKERFNSD
jgi:hypothetical protein